MGFRLVRSPILHTFFAIVALLLASVPAARVQAQTRDVILWLPTVNEGARVEAAQLETVLGEILASASDARHIVGRPGLRRALENREFTLPPCFTGAEPCMSAEHAVLQTLGIDLVVRIEASGRGETLALTVLDGSLSPRSTQVLVEDDLRLAAFAAVATATGATARISVNSQPVATTVLVDGEPVGTTPWSATLPVGMYRVTLTADGYFDNTTNLELRAGETRNLAIDMSRRYATLTLSSGTPDAQVFVDDSASPWPTNSPILLEPGSYQVAVRSADYDPFERQVELVAGEDRTISVNLLLSRETIRRRERERILAAPWMLQLGAHLDGTGMSLQGAHGEAFGRDVTLRCPAARVTGIPVVPGQPAPDPCGDNSGVFSPALEADLIYAWRFFEVGVVGLGYRLLPISRDGREHLTRSGDFVDIERGRAVSLRFPSVGVRWLFGPMIEPYLRTGPILDFERFRGTEAGAALAPGEVTLRRNSLWWEGRAGVRVHANRLVYGFVDGHIAANVSHPNDGTRGGATLGVGLNLPDVFGLDDLLNRRFPQRGSSPRPASQPAQPTNSLPEQL